MEKKYINEIWRPIKGYEGLYEVSNLGRIKSLKRLVKKWDGYRIVPEKILTPRANNRGYLRINLCKDGITKTFSPHRLVAEAFIPNPDNLPCVNHKDENPLNNVVSNLEWCTYSYNNSYGTRLERVRDKQINGKKSKPVLQYTIDGEFVREWPSAMDAERNGGFSSACIYMCCKGKIKKHQGCIWRYK